MKLFLKIFTTIVIVLIGIVISMQGVTKIYRNSISIPFAGPIFYNPYAQITPQQWAKGFMKANFHAHTRWDVNGNYTVEEFEQAYIYSGYDIVGISDHNHLTTDLKERKWYTPTYEHGYGLNNYHILVLGATKVDYLDNLFMIMPLQQMQYAIERLSSQSRAISINHPERIRSVSEDVIGQLRGFRMLEINPDADTRFWDNLLSAGNYVTLIASDDAHSITNRGSWFQRAFTMVCPNQINSQDIISALENGQAYAVTVTTERNNKGPHKEIPTLTQFQINNDTLNVAFSIITPNITFIGNGGEKLLSLKNVPAAQYVIPNNVNYVRVVADMGDGITIFTNPAARTQNGQIPKLLPIPQNVPWLSTLNTIGWILIAAIFTTLTLLALWRKPRKKINFENVMWGAGQKPYDPS